MSTSGDVQYIGGYHNTCGGYLTDIKGGFPLFAETTRSELASTRQLAEQFPVIAS